MDWHFSNKTGWLHEDINPKPWPKDAQPVDDATRDEMVRKSHEGRGVSLDKAGKPVYAEHSLPVKDRWAIHRQSAEMALRESTELVMASYEAGEPVHPAVVEYRKKLRAIVAAETGEPGALPARPAL